MPTRKSSEQGQLLGKTPPKPENRRNRRALGKVATLLEEEDRLDAITAAKLDALRELAESLDRMHFDAGRSEHTVAQVARVYLDTLNGLVEKDTGSSPIRLVIDDITAAVRDSASS